MTGMEMLVVKTVAELGIFDIRCTRPKPTSQQGNPIEVNEEAQEECMASQITLCSILVL
jgi:hypothetical protein